MKPQDFIRMLAPAAQACAASSGVPAGFTIAQAALESAWGESGLAKQGRNLFGIKADAAWQGDVLVLPTKEFLKGSWTTVYARWRKYANWQECLEDHAAFLRRNRRYAPAFDHSEDSEAFARAVAAAGYATDPNYADKLVATIRARGLAALDRPAVPGADAAPTLQEVPMADETDAPAGADSSSSGPGLMGILGTVAGFLNPALGVAMQVAPQLVRLFGTPGSAQTERNAKALEAIGPVVGDTMKQITGQPTYEGAAQKLQTDPAAAAAFREAVAQQFDQWLGGVVKVAGLEETSRGSARQFATDYAKGPRNVPLEIVTYCAIGIFGLAVFAVIGAWVAAALSKVDAQVVLSFNNAASMALQAALTGGGVAFGFWLGSSFGSMMKNPSQRPPAE